MGGGELIDVPDFRGMQRFNAWLAGHEIGLLLSGPDPASADPLVHGIVRGQWPYAGARLRRWDVVTIWVGDLPNDGVREPRRPKPTRPELAAADDVREAAERRGRALTAGDAGTLRQLLHPDFVWVSHTGETFDLDSYLRSNIGGPNRWHGQRLSDTRIAVAGDVAVLLCVVTDIVDRGTGAQEFRMLMTQTWVRDETQWRCLAGHAGPLINQAQAAD